MNFNNYEIPKEYTNKFKVTSKDKRDFKKFKELIKDTKGDV